MQGIHDFIPTEKKIAYINSILACGFDSVDFGSFVSPRTIPQMRDTAEVLRGLDLSGPSKLLAIIANLRGAEDACAFEEIRYLGFPFSISETFQQRNTNSSILESLKRVEEIQSLAMRSRKEVVIYISMAFGNPYGDPWNGDIAVEWTRRLSSLGIKIFAMADTIGVSNPDTIRTLFNSLNSELKDLEFGAHLHTTPGTWKEKLEAAWTSGCRRFDSAIKGFGGCPMAADQLTGNMATENLLSFLKEKNAETGIRNDQFGEAMKNAVITFPS